jgi:hypothetical protein
MKTIYQILAIFAVCSLLVWGGLVGYLIASGRLNSQSANLIAAALRGEAPVPSVAAVPAPTPQTTQTASTTQPAMDPVAGEAYAALLSREKRTIQDMEHRLRDAQLKQIQAREQFMHEVEQFEAQARAQQKAGENEGHTKALAMYEEMSPKQAKEDFMKLDLPIVVSYLISMSDRSRTKILREFKTPAEQERRRQITELIRNQGLALADDPPGGATR